MGVNCKIRLHIFYNFSIFLYKNNIYLLHYLYGLSLYGDFEMMSLNGGDYDFRVCESYCVSIIMDGLRSPHNIPTAHCHEFHIGRESPRDDRGGMFLYEP